jgi:hypothetical protein
LKYKVSISIPTEAPSFGKSTEDGQGTIVVGYFKMKDSTRAILQLITADDYNPPSEDPGADPQKQMLNGVKLWEQVSDCAQAVSVMQAAKLKFKYLPTAVLQNGTNRQQLSSKV